MTGEYIFNLGDKIETLLDGKSLKAVQLAAKELSTAYRNPGKKGLPPLKNDIHILAYALTRMSATYAALCSVLKEFKQRMPHFSPSSLLDVGSGPGTTLWAMDAFYPQLQAISLIEKNAHFLSLGKKLAEDLALYPHSQWFCMDMEKLCPSLSADLVIASYSLGELSESSRTRVLEKLWAMTKKVLIIIEPGTPEGFAKIRAFRRILSAYLIAPCPHAEECPLSEGDWCHFYARLNRSSLHRKSKEASLGYEDEKFSYLIFSREKVVPCQSRILRHPHKGKGHINLQLCTPQGVQAVICTKKEGELYRIAKKSKWGDAY